LSDLWPNEPPIDNCANILESQTKAKIGHWQADQTRNLKLHPKINFENKAAQDRIRPLLSGIAFASYFATEPR
jgi:hypothetical protein